MEKLTGACIIGQSGKAADVLREYGLTADQIAATIKANI